MSRREASRFNIQATLGCLLLGFSVVPTVFAQDTESFEYDALGRLVKLENTAAGKQVEYSYDAAGNRTQVDVNGGLPSSSFVINDVSATEGGTATFIVTKVGATTQTHAVNYVTSNNTATASSDYVSKSGTLSFGATEFTKTVSISTTNDSTHEVGENFFITLSNPTNGATIDDAQGTGAISDNDPAPAFLINNVSVGEGGNLLFTVTKSGSTSLSHNVSYATANSAAGSSDYASTSGTLVFTPGQTSKTVSVSTTEDSVHEVNEALHVNLSNSTSGATISDSQGIGTINDDDPAPSFSINNRGQIESQWSMVFTITKSGTTSRTHAVSYATSPGTASTADYSSISGSLSFTSGQTTKTVVVPITGDLNQEGTEYFYLNLSSPTNSATISDSQGIGTIYDDDNGCGFSCE